MNPLTWFVTRKPELEGGAKFIQNHREVQERSELEELKRTIEERDRQVAALRNEARGTKEETRLKDEALSIRVRDEEESTRKMAELQKTLEQLHNINSVLEGQLQTRVKEKKAIEDELRHLKAEHTQTQTLLATRTSELKGAQAFLSKADCMSGAEVIRMVEALNAEILQAAAFMAESFEFGMQEDDEAEELEQASQRLGQFLDPSLTHLLRSNRHDEDPMLVQVAFQACMIEFTRWIITAWCFDNSQDEHLLGIFARMLKEEAQAISGRWRSLTRRYGQMAHSESEVLSHFTPTVIEALYDITILADCKSEPWFVEERFTKFGERVTVILKMALRMNKAIGEEITSADFEMITVPYGVEFESTSMDDADGGSPRNRGEEPAVHVLCTTDLGLRRVEKVSKEGEMQLKQIVLLKPKVALTSMVEEMARGE